MTTADVTRETSIAVGAGIPATTLTVTVPGAVIEEAWGLILADMASGTLPADLPDFSTAHDFVDANDYLLEPTMYLPESKADAQETDEGLNRWNALLNVLSDVLDERLKDRAAAATAYTHADGRTSAVWAVDDARSVFVVVVDGERVGRVLRITAAGADGVEVTVRAVALGADERGEWRPSFVHAVGAVVGSPVNGLVKSAA